MLMLLVLVLYKVSSSRSDGAQQLLSRYLLVAKAVRSQTEVFFYFNDTGNFIGNIFPTNNVERFGYTCAEQFYPVSRCWILSFGTWSVIASSLGPAVQILCHMLVLFPLWTVTLRCIHEEATVSSLVTSISLHCYFKK